MKSSLVSILITAFGLSVTACGPAHEHDESAEVVMDDVGHANEVHVDDEVAAQQGIRVAVAEFRVLTPMLTVPARVTVSQEEQARVVSPVEGRILEFSGPIGVEVATGDALAVIHSPAFVAAQREWLLALRAVESTQPLVTLAHEAWKRAEELHTAQGDPPRAEVQRRESEYRRIVAEQTAATGKVEQLRDVLLLWGMLETELDALGSSGQLMEHYVLRAPLDGRVIERHSTVGEFAGPDHDPVMTIANMQSLWVLANFPESRLRSLRIGAEARLMLESEPGHGCPGTVTYISPVLDLSNRTVEVRIQPEDRHEDLRPGLFARAEIDLAEVDGVSINPVAVPESAVSRLDGQVVVFVPVADEPGTYTPRSVRIGRTVRGWVPILDGLSVGEAFVAEGAFLLKAEFEKSEGGHDH